MLVYIGHIERFYSSKSLVSFKDIRRAIFNSSIKWNFDLFPITLNVSGMKYGGDSRIL